MLGGRAAWAAGPLGANGTPINTSAYSLDVFQGPVLGGGRTTALAGATGAIPEGALGNAVSSASPAARDPWSRDWFDWDADITLSLPSSLRESDFDNNGKAGLAYEQFLYGAVGGLIQLGRWGISVSGERTTYTLGGSAGQPRLDAFVTRTRLVLARQLLDGSLVVGAGIRGVDMGFSSVSADGNQNKTLLTLSGAAFQGGFLFAPAGKPFRVAFEARSPVSSDQVEGEVQPNANGDLLVADPGGRTFFVPRSVRLPWETELSAALQLGGRPLNVPWVDPRVEERRIEAVLVAERTRWAREEKQRDLTEKERDELSDHAKAIRRARDRARYRKLPRQKVLLTASVLLTGGAENGVGAESFLLQTVERSGRRLSVTPRAGVEVEPIHGRLQIRGGSYLEPTRFDTGRARVHGTFGVDVRVLEWTVFGLFDEGTRWRLGTFIDLADRYASISGTLGVWH